MKIAMIVVSLMLASAAPALATDKPGGDTYNQNWDHSTNTTQNLNFLQRIDQRLSSMAEANQKQRQDQAQGQGQTQTATGGAANNSNNVNVDNRTRITNAPPVYGNGDTYAASGAVAGVALGIAVPSRAYGRGQIGRNIMEFQGSRAALYTQCGLPDTDRALALLGIACDKHGREFEEYENGIRQAEYQARLEQWERQEAARLAAASKPRREAPRKAPIPTPAPVDCRPTPAPFCPR